MNDTALTVRDQGHALATAIQLWADARTDPTSQRRADLLRDKARAVGDFFSWCGKPVYQATPLDVKAWQAALEDRGLAKSTIYAMISRVSSFYTWAMSDPDLAERITRNPVDLARPKAPKPYQSESTKSLDDQEVRDLVDVVKEKASFDVVGKRDYALLLLFLATGLRRSEVIRLRWGDVRINGNLTLTTRIKGRDRLTLEVDDPRVLRALVAYLQASGRWGNLEADDPLWTRHDRAGQPGKALKGHALAANLKRYAAKVGIAEFHLHQTRHTFARIVGDATGSLGETQEALGHRNQATTRVYLQRVGLKRDRHSNGILDRAGA